MRLLRAMRARSSAADGAVVAGVRIFMTGASTVITGVLPLLIGLFAERLHLNWQQIGWVGAVGQAGTLVGTLLAYWLVERRSVRLGMQLGAACALAFTLLTAGADSYGALLSCRALTSVGVGCVFAIGTYLLSRSSVPARSFSIMSGVQVACGSLHAALLPWIYAHSGYLAAVSSVAFWFAVILLLALWVPEREVMETAAGAAELERETPREASLASVRLLGSIIGFQSAVVVIWVYSERMAAAAGLPAGEIGTAIAVGNLGGVPAAVLGGWVGERFGYIPMLSLATAAVLCGDWLTFKATPFATYLGGQFLLNFGWMLGVSYYLGLLARVDVGGRMIRLAPASLVIAGALGPVCVASFTSGNSAAPILGMSFAFAGSALVLATYRR